MAHKYNAKPLWYNPRTDTASEMIAVTSKEARIQGYLYFASTLEYEVFRTVRAFLSKMRLNYSIDTQHTIEILPKLESIKAITWCVDFKVEYAHPKHDDYHGVLYVEAKGIELEEYKLKMNLLNRFKPELARNVRVIHNTYSVEKILGNFLQARHGK